MYFTHVFHSSMYVRYLSSSAGIGYSLAPWEVVPGWACYVAGPSVPVDWTVAFVAAYAAAFVVVASVVVAVVVAAAEG